MGHSNRELSFLAPIPRPSLHMFFLKELGAIWFATTAPFSKFGDITGFHYS